MVSLPYFLGCPSWNEAAWRGSFYPRELRSADYLGHYGGIFNAVEGNTTFYARPSAETVRRWAETMPAGFRFCAKFPRDISHEGDLRERLEAAGDFLELLAPLGERVSPLWLQLVEEVHGVQHLTIGVVELHHAAVDEPHGEHLGRPITTGNAAATVDPDVFLKIGSVVMVGSKLNEEPDHHFPDVCGIHVQTHHKQPPVAVWSDDLMSHAGGTVTSSPNLTEGWFSITRCSNRFSYLRHR